MIKCEVLDTCNIVVAKGSIVEVSERQYELARKFLKPLKAEKKEIKSEEPVKVEETTEKVEEVKVPQIEKRTKKKK